ncbi:hypothetical protein [Paenibacillus pini]|uniref:Uncharacterized protein n=1 Tax=Paenibacillus pini JCM 16418 TaxID=1236976 RepID=W7Y748_9BACL|nr:hypothetical protein [Paenibacillus pini]GAF06770.1 hypothetical protein JCM16418_751 [Paenibacillus pini JCM 16418]
MHQSPKSSTLLSQPLHPAESVKEAIHAEQSIREVPFPLWNGYIKGQGKLHLPRA